MKPKQLKQYVCDMMMRGETGAYLANQDENEDSES